MKNYYLIYILSLFFAILPSHTTTQSTRDDFWLEMGDGIMLDVTRITPTGDQPPGGFPAIIFVHGLGGSKTIKMAEARSYADSGYVTVTYSVRGQGNSEGLSTVFSTREQKDLEFIINWLADKPYRE